MNLMTDIKRKDNIMNISFKIIYALSILFGFSCIGCKVPPRLFVGRFTKPGEKGLYIYEFNRRNGDLELLTEVDAGPSPSFMCISEKKGLVYAANEVMEFKGMFGGGLTTLKYDGTTGSFDKVNEMHIPYGGPCHISLSHYEDYLFVANYPNGSVAVIRLDEQGVPDRITDTILYIKKTPYISNAHMIIHDPAGKRVYVSDLGLDRIVIYDFDREKGKLVQLEKGIISLPKKSGPRHFTFNADGSMMYLINEFGSTVMVFKVDNEEGLILMQTLPTIREGFDTDNYCADIHIGPDGKFLYGSNRGENTIVVYTIESDGLLSLAGHTSCGGDWPRNFTIDPSGKFIIIGNQKSNYISVFRIDRKSGFPSGESKNYEIDIPAFHKFTFIR